MFKKNLIKYYLLLRQLPFIIFGKKPLVLSFDKTIDAIISEKKSFSRFGDGEIRMMLNSGEIGFQSKNAALTKRLGEVLKSNIPNLMIGLPNTYGIITHHTLDSRIFWYGFNMIYAKVFIKELNLKKIYGDTNITRFYMAYKNKDKQHIQSKINKLKTIWQNQDLLIVEGERTKLGIGNDLFANALSIERILCPSKNAFDQYEKILSSVKRYGGNKLVLIALGPTASILAYDLAKLNYWSLDIGHIDIEYLWFLNNAKTKTAVVGKYVQESKEQLISSEADDENYTKSIIQIIK